jgi:hypothetical protein
MLGKKYQHIVKSNKCIQNPDTFYYLGQGMFQPIYKIMKQSYMKLNKYSIRVSIM